MLQQGKYREVLDLTRRDDSYFSQVLHAALRDANHGFAVMLRNLEQASEEHTANRFRRIEYLNVLGQVSPMIGLFGTVYGMILAFQGIVVAGGNADPVLLAGGIGTALTTTFWGLVVAIPALSGYAVVRNKIDALTAEASLAAEDIVAQFRPRPQNGKSNGGNG
jgi:biopolymer transport protein ExbB